MVAPAIVAAGLGLLGGILGRNSERRAIAAQNEYNNPANIRARAEAAGFNPLLFVGPGVGNQMATGGSNFMGSAIADAGLMLSEALAKRQDLRKLDRLKDENQKLNQQVTNLTIRPKFGGIYAQREAIPTKRAALGGVNAEAAAQAAVGLSGNSPLAGAVVGPDDGNLTGVQLSVKKDVPAFRLFGHDFYGSGAFSTGQQFEDSVGENEIFSTLYSPVVITDALVNEGYKLGGRIKDARVAAYMKANRGFRSGGVAYAQKPVPHAVRLQDAFGADWYKQQFPR